MTSDLPAAVRPAASRSAVPDKAAPMAEAVLIIRGAGNWVYRRDLSRHRDTVLGRRADCDIKLGHPQVSGRHARVFWDGEAYAVEDLGSSNHTYLNGYRLEGRKRLRDGDVIKAGPYALVFRADEKEPVSTTLSQSLLEELLARRDRRRETGSGEHPAPDQAEAQPEPMRDIKKLARELRRLRERQDSEDDKAAPDQLRAALDRALDALEAAWRLGRRQKAQNRLLRMLALASDGEAESWRGMAEAARSLLGADVCFLMLIAAETGKWEIRHWSGEIADDLGVASAERPPASMTLAGKAVSGGQAIRSEDLSSSSLDAAESLVAHQIHSAIAAPIAVSHLSGGHREIVGCLYADRRGESARRPYESEDLADAAACAEILGDAVLFWAFRQARPKEAEREQ
jgi:pSer/pThr/pTyr-binding forkhead associated (FHA) protein